MALPEDWKIHPVFHVSLLRAWRAADVHEDQPVSREDIPDVEEPYWEVEKILRWRKVKRGRKIVKEYLVLWKGFPASEASWVSIEQFIRPELLHTFIQEDKPLEEKL